MTIFRDKELIDGFKVGLSAFGTYIPLQMRSVQYIGYDAITDTTRSITLTRGGRITASAVGKSGLAVAIAEDKISIGTVTRKSNGNKRGRHETTRR